MPRRQKLALRLYVAGGAPNSLHAIRNLKAVCDGHFPSAYDLEIVDLLVDAKRAMQDRVVVTPTLLKLSPAPARRVIGALSDAEQLLRTLESR